MTRESKGEEKMTTQTAAQNTTSATAATTAADIENQEETTMNTQTIKIAGETFDVSTEELWDEAEEACAEALDTIRESVREVEHRIRYSLTADENAPLCASLKTETSDFWDECRDELEKERGALKRYIKDDNDAITIEDAAVVSILEEVDEVLREIDEKKSEILSAA